MRRKKQKSEPKQAFGKWRSKPIPVRCIECPYQRSGIICWDRDGSCTRTDVEELRSQRRRNV